MLREILTGRHALHLDAYAAYRHRRTRPFLIRGDIRTLNIGTGGGVETLEMLRRGNRVTTLEMSESEAKKTRWRVELNGFADRHDSVIGHVRHVELPRRFHQIVMLEVLEHVLDDHAVVERLSSWLEPSGRLVLSTPTSSWGQLPGDCVEPEETVEGHVRVGYDGPELDAMLHDAGLIPLRRVPNGHVLVQWAHRAERWLRTKPPTLPLGLVFSVALRPLMPLLDWLPLRPHDQITIAVKNHRAPS